MKYGHCGAFVTYSVLNQSIQLFFRYILNSQEFVMK
ncbi:MAG: hypothetical protein ACI86C_001459, partial [Candidatus Latescibacterota bacterium]